MGATDQETNSPNEQEKQATPHEEVDPAEKTEEEMPDTGEGNSFEGFIIAILWEPINGLVGLARSFHKKKIKLNHIYPYMIPGGWEKGGRVHSLYPQPDKTLALTPPQKKLPDVVH